MGVAPRESPGVAGGEAGEEVVLHEERQVGRDVVIACRGRFEPLLQVGALADAEEAFRAVVNVGSSWLSREIVFGGLFATLLAAVVLEEIACAGPCVSSSVVVVE